MFEIFALLINLLILTISDAMVTCYLFSFYPHVRSSPTQRITPQHLLHSYSIICRGNLTQEFVVAICRENLSQEFAVEICRRNLPWEFAAEVCCGYLP